MDVDPPEVVFTLGERIKGASLSVQAVEDAAHGLAVTLDRVLTVIAIQAAKDILGTAEVGVAFVTVAVVQRLEGGLLDGGQKLGFGGKGGVDGDCHGQLDSFLKIKITVQPESFPDLHRMNRIFRWGHPPMVEVTVPEKWV